jgi:hypothetical protein
MANGVQDRERREEPGHDRDQDRRAHAERGDERKGEQRPGDGTEVSMVRSKP